MAENESTDETEVPAEPESGEEAVTEVAAEAEPAEQPVAPDAAAEEPAAESEAEPEPAVETASAEPQAPVPQSGPKPKRKRLPRRHRPQKTRPQRPGPSGTRTPIVREPKPERERGRSQERRGVVVSNAMDKTIVVKVDLIKSHPKYKKVVRRSVKFHAHDEQNAANVGDVVRIVETRPLSATKRWRLAEIVEVAK